MPRTTGTCARDKPVAPVMPQPYHFHSLTVTSPRTVRYHSPLPTVRLTCTTPHSPRFGSVSERYIDLHPILRHHRLFEHLPRLLHELLGADRIAGRHVAQDQTLRIRGERHLGGFARRRVPRLLRPILLLLPKGRLVNEQIRPLRRVHDGRARTRIAREHHASSPTLLPYDSLRYDFPSVRYHNRLPPLQLAPQGAFGDAGRPGLLRIEPTQPLVLPYRIADRPAAMVCCKHVNIVPFPLPP